MAGSNMGTDSSPVSSTSLAVLIDADNTPPKIVDGLFEEIAKFGTASVKRIYGDWTKPNLGGWKNVLLKHSVQLGRLARDADASVHARASVPTQFYVSTRNFRHFRLSPTFPLFLSAGLRTARPLSSAARRADYQYPDFTHV